MEKSLNFLDAQKASKLLLQLMRDCDEIRVASAWGTLGKEAKCLLENSSKFRFVIFGVSFCQTDPDLIDQLVGKDNAYVADTNDRGIFHPKLYIFSTGNRADAIIGSSNLTRGGLSSNFEANIHISGPIESKVFEKIFSSFAEYWKIKQPITNEYAKYYRLKFNAVQKPRDNKHPKFTANKSEAKKLNSDLVNLTWGEYVTRIEAIKKEFVLDRLAMLRKCQELLASVASFSDLDDNSRRAIAGTIGENQAIEADLGDHDWAAFGSMGGLGDFANRINENDKSLAKAMEIIPRFGDVDRENYKEFCKHFVAAFRNSARVGSYATASRLLAMKRPDLFVCVCDGNKRDIAEALGFAPSTLDRENYWDRVIEAIRLSPWFNSPRPSGEQAELWDNRVAMLDIFYYKP